MKLLTTAILLFTFPALFAQEKVLYKQVDSTQLFLEVYQPLKVSESKKFPAMVFFFGGGWLGGSTTQFIPQAKYFSNRGVVCFLVDYRVANRNKTTPFEALKDAKSAMRFIRQNAQNFSVDTSKTIAVGGSAGGHLAAATALVSGYNERTDNLSFSCVPKALVLFNPVIDNSAAGYGYERINENYKDFSPLHNIQKSAPPTIIFLGTKDNLIPVETARYYRMAMEKVGSICELLLYEGQQHGFFNQKKYQDITTLETERFLTRLGFLNGK